MARSIKQTLQYLLLKSKANFTYTGFASNMAGDDFSTEYVEGLHLYKATIYVNTRIINLDSSYFSGQWVSVGQAAELAGYMKKEVYDVDEDGIVDLSETAITIDGGTFN